MTAPHSPDYHEGFRVGYREGEADLTEWISETFDDWRSLKVYTHEELFAMHELVAEIRLRQARREH